MQREVEKTGTPRYLQVYEFYKDLIISGQMQPGTKLPSIRKGSIQLQISRTTMEAAYMLLAAEGYISSRPQSGYYVTDMAEQKKERMVAAIPKKRKTQEIRYDFVTSNVDKESFKFDLWRRYMKSALRQDEKLLSYGEPQGEEEFRIVLADYLRETRNVVCMPEQIVIGAGIQSLLHILCPILKERKTIAFYNTEFLQGHAIFEDHGFEIKNDTKKAEIYYISPSQLLKTGGIFSIGERLGLIKEAAEKNQLIIEDDYNSEFQYFQKPVPSIQGLAGGRGVIYLGTFSKMLLPSIRMSFMVLPPELLGEYEKRKHYYNQTASKAEQIAIAQFIRDGHLASQIRKSRKIHMTKAEELVKVAGKKFAQDAEIHIEESGFRVFLEIETTLEATIIEKKAKEKGVLISVLPMNESRVQIILTCTNVSVDDFENALERIKECVF